MAELQAVVAETQHVVDEPVVELQAVVAETSVHEEVVTVAPEEPAHSVAEASVA